MQFNYFGGFENIASTRNLPTLVISKKWSSTLTISAIEVRSRCAQSHPFRSNPRLWKYSVYPELAIRKKIAISHITSIVDLACQADSLVVRSKKSTLRLSLWFRSRLCALYYGRMYRRWSQPMYSESMQNYHFWQILLTFSPLVDW